MVPEIPTGFTGFWATVQELHAPGSRSSIEYNGSFPTTNGTTSNSVFSFQSSDMFTYVFGPWVKDTPLSGVVNGCSGGCRTTLRAPALVPRSCTSHEIPLHLRSDFNTTKVYDGLSAAPFDSYWFTIAFDILLQGGESIIVDTAYATTNRECTGTLNRTTCEFVAGVADYGVTVQDSNIMMDTVELESFVALANNSAVNNTFVPSQYGHTSTLAGIVALLLYKWQAYEVYYLDEDNNAGAITYGIEVLAEFTQKGIGDPVCTSFTDPYEKIVDSINKLMLYTGAHAAKESAEYLRANLDPGLTTHSTVPGYVFGHHDVYHADYWFFLAAAMVEFLCIVLIAPTCKRPPS